MAFEVRPIRTVEREECIQLWCTVWPGAESDAYFRKYFYGDVEWLPYYTQVGLLDGKIVTAAHICKRTVACGDAQLTMGALANVATLPEYRGQGYNSACLQRTIAIMEADAMDFSFLGTGINAYYERLGYATLPLPWISGPLRASVGTDLITTEQDSWQMQNLDFGTLRSSVPAEWNPFRVRPATAADSTRIQEIYREYNHGRPITVERSAAYWRDWIGISDTSAAKNALVALDADGRVQGYVCLGEFLSAVPYSDDAVGQRVTELGVSNDADSLLCSAALLKVVAVFAVRSRAPELRLAIALEPSVQAVVERLLAQVHEHVDHSMMVRLLHPDNLLKSLTPAWNERWIAAGRPTGTVAFATPYGAVTLDANGNFLRVRPAHVAGDTLPQHTFFGLLFGLTPADQCGASAIQIPLLQSLFPPQAAVFYGADGF